MSDRNPAGGAQRLSVERLRQWRALEYGMFIHFGMNTYSPDPPPNDNIAWPLSLYRPEQLDVDEWIRVARDAGMRYAMLTTRHNTGFCLWPTKQHDYHVGESDFPTDVVDAFVNACHKYKIKPAFYLNAFDRNHMHGSTRKSEVLPPFEPYITQAYLDFMKGTIDELLTQYGDVEEFWIDGAMQMGAYGRREIYSHIAARQPNTVIAMNMAFLTEGVSLKIKDAAWPTDVMAIEQSPPPYATRGERWYHIAPPEAGGEARDYFIPTESSFYPATKCSHWWFGGQERQPYSQLELLALRLLCRERNTNCVFNIAPTPAGRVHPRMEKALLNLPALWEKVADWGMDNTGED